MFVSGIIGSNFTILFQNGLMNAYPHTIHQASSFSQGIQSMIMLIAPIISTSFFIPLGYKLVIPAAILLSLFVLVAMMCINFKFCTIKGVADF